MDEEYVVIASPDEIMTQLVEIAAQLQAELHRNARLEAENIRLARMETIAQSAVTLNHEINNPLCVIYGATENVLSHLKRLAASGAMEEAGTLCTRLERILDAAERISQTMQTFSETTRAVTKDYVPGVSMLELTEPAR